MEAKFIHYVCAAYPYIIVKTSEEFRAIRSLLQILSRKKFKDQTGGAKNYQTLVWDMCDGVHAINTNGSIGAEALVAGQNISGPFDYLKETAEEGTVLFMKDFHPFLKPEFPHQVETMRLMRNLAEVFRAQKKCVVFISPTFKIPKELETEMIFVDFKLPTREEIKVILTDLCRSQQLASPEGQILENIIDSAMGLTAIEAENAFAISLICGGTFDPKIIRNEKAQIVKKNGTAEMVDTDLTLNDLGGWENVKEWLRMKVACQTPAAKAFGVKPVKGVVFCGVQGGGKSLAAKIFGNAFNRPVVRLDVGRIFGSYIGESEENLDTFLRMVESIAPCILFIDEVEKGLAGNQAGHEGHETTRRVFQMLLTWLQDKQQDVILVATANSLETIPPEFTRPGRIDAMFYVDLPTEVQRKEIFKIHLRKAGRNPKLFDEQMPEILSLCKNWTGAEIEVWVNEALSRAFQMGHSDILIEDLKSTVGNICPVSKSNAAGIDRGRALAVSKGMRFASTQEPALLQAAGGRSLNNNN